MKSYLKVALRHGVLGLDLMCNKGDEIMADGYMDMICRAQTLDDLDRIVEAAANNFNITNKEYAEVYERSLQKAKSWANI